MESVTWGFLGTLLGAIVGAASSVITTFIMARNARQLNHESAILERKERAREAQLRNFYELQDTLTYMMRLTGRAHHEDTKSFLKARNKDRPVLLSNELDQEINVVIRKLTVLIERIHDDVLRENVRTFGNNLLKVMLATNYEQSKLNMDESVSAYRQMMEEIGVQLRHCQSGID